MSEREEDPQEVVVDGQGIQLDYGTRCRRAIDALTTADIRKLRRYATLRMSAYRGMIFNSDADELLDEAIVRTLEQKRKWNYEHVDFVTHLLGCMRSIANGLIVRAYREVEVLTEYERNRQKEEFDHYWPKQILDQVRHRLRNDGVALQVLDLALLENSRREICQALNMRADVYDAARKRISRCIDSLAEEWRRQSQKNDQYYDHRLPKHHV